MDGERLTFISEQLEAATLNETIMRVPVMLGIALIVIGGTIFLRGLSAPRTILKVGDVSVSAAERNPVAPWVSGLSILAGIALVTTGKRRKA